MAKTATLNMRIEPKVKEEAESLYSSLGMTLTEAVNIFLHKSIMEGGIPFEVKQRRYNHKTESAIVEARSIMSGDIEAESYESAAEMLATLEE